MPLYDATKLPWWRRSQLPLLSLVFPQDYDDEAIASAITTYTLIQAGQNPTALDELHDIVRTLRKTGDGREALDVAIAMHYNDRYRLKTYPLLGRCLRDNGFEFAASQAFDRADDVQLSLEVHGPPEFGEPPALAEAVLTASVRDDDIGLDLITSVRGASDFPQVWLRELENGVTPAEVTGTLSVRESQTRRAALRAAEVPGDDADDLDAPEYYFDELLATEAGDAVAQEDHPLGEFLGYAPGPYDNEADELRTALAGDPTTPPVPDFGIHSQAYDLTPTPLPEPLEHVMVGRFAAALKSAQRLVDAREFTMKSSEFHALCMRRMLFGQITTTREWEYVLYGTAVIHTPDTPGEVFNNVELTPGDVERLCDQAVFALHQRGYRIEAVRFGPSHVATELATHLSHRLEAEMLWSDEQLQDHTLVVLQGEHELTLLLDTMRDDYNPNFPYMPLLEPDSQTVWLYAQDGPTLPSRFAPNVSLLYGTARWPEMLAPRGSSPSTKEIRRANPGLVELLARIGSTGEVPPHPPRYRYTGHHRFEKPTT